MKNKTSSFEAGMKRFSLFLTLVVCLSPAVYGQTRSGEKQKYLAGHVQAISVETAGVIEIVAVRAGGSGPREGRRSRSMDYLYDERGNLIVEIRYAYGNVSQREVFKHDDKGNLVEEARYESKDSPVEKTVLTYNAGGKRAESLLYDEKGKLTDRIVYRYDSAGRLAEKLFYKDEKLTGKDRFVYDGEGRTTEIIAYDSKGVISGQIQVTYDDKAKSVGKSRNLEGKTVTAYDQKGNVSVIDHYRPDGLPAWKWEFEYDDRGNVIRERFANRVSLSMWQYDYEYDSMGNWTKKTTSQFFNEKGKLKPFFEGATYRKFKYYSKTGGIAPIADPEGRRVFKDEAISMVASEIRPRISGATFGSVSSGASSGRPVINRVIEVEVVIDTEGSVESAKVISGRDAIVHEVAEWEQAIREWQYRPRLIDGLPVKVIDTLTFRYGVPPKPRGVW